MSDAPWDVIEREAKDAFRGAGRFPVRAYSELMPAPFVGLKPYAPVRAAAAATFGIDDPGALDIDEYELAHDVEPGLDHVAKHLIDELGKLVRGASHALSRTLLAGNPAWPDELAAAAKAGKLAHDPLVVMCALALSRTEDDKGNEKWTLFGASHDGPSAPFWHDMTEDALGELVAWAGLDGDWRVVAEPATLDASLRRRVLGSDDVAGLRAIVTFTPFAQLPDRVRAAYLAGTLALVPSPATLVFFEHPRYRALAAELPRATQIPLLHVFPRVEGGYRIRIPQSGWLDEDEQPSPHPHHGHTIVSKLERTHRWQRKARDEGLTGDETYTDKVAVALFSTEPADVELYAKPMARNAQLWTEDYHLLLDGPSAQREQIVRAAQAVDAGGRFGYRMYYPPMRAGLRELFWHVPLVARPGAGRYPEAPIGYVTAERPAHAPLVLAPRLLVRPTHIAAARLFPRENGHARYTTSHNARKLLDTRDLLGEPLAPAHARALLHVARTTHVEDWLADLPARATDRNSGARLASALRGCLGPARDPGAPLVLDGLGTRAFEEAIWASIYELAHGEFRQKNDADGIAVNKGKHGGKAAKAAHVVTHERRDLEALGDHLHARYRALIDKHGMAGRAEVVDHVFRWETDFPFAWMEGWAKNQQQPAERNIVLMIPGANRRQAVVMGDHYDTAYMEDVYYEESGGDLLRAPARGADDNHSATTALLLAADQLLALAKQGRLQRDVWLVHLTGEEFPGDCMGARALCQALVERSLAFTAEDGTRRDVADVEIVAAYILDMIGHNTERDRDVFMIAPGEGAGSARLARRAHEANERWNRCAEEWNRTAARRGLGRAKRVADAKQPPPAFEHLHVHGEIRVEWEPRSALFNTDGQIFSDLGIPVVLFMENYDISRKGYHDTHDTLENIDLDYCAALTAIAIETVADTACAREL